MRVIAMRWRPYANDLVNHTLRHFLGNGHYFDYPADSARGQSELRAAVAKAEPWVSRELGRLNKDSEDAICARPSWWQGRAGAAVRHAHDLGYQPRYRALVTKLPAPGDRGSTWYRAFGRYTAKAVKRAARQGRPEPMPAHQSGDTWMRYSRYVVFGTWSWTERTLRVNSAYKEPGSLHKTQLVNSARKRAAAERARAAAQRNKK